MAEVYGNLVIVVILVMEGVDRAALRITAMTLVVWEMLQRDEKIGGGLKNKSMFF